MAYREPVEIQSIPISFLETVKNLAKTQSVNRHQSADKKNIKKAKLSKNKALLRRTSYIKILNKKIIQAAKKGKFSIKYDGPIFCRWQWNSDLTSELKKHFLDEGFSVIEYENSNLDSFYYSSPILDISW